MTKSLTGGAADGGDGLNAEKAVRDYTVTDGIRSRWGLLRITVCECFQATAPVGLILNLLRARRWQPAHVAMTAKHQKLRVREGFAGVRNW